MSQCCARQRRITLSLLICCMSLLGGSCSKEALKEAALSGEEEGEQYDPVVPRFRNKSEPEVLRPLEVITGGLRGQEGMVSEFARIVTGSHQAVRLDRPVAVGGQGDTMFIVDAGERAIYRYNRLDKSIVTLGEAGKQFAGDPMGISVLKDLSFFVADPVGKRVLYFDFQGNLLRSYFDLKNLSRPIDVLFDELTQKLYVADGSFSHVVVFDRMGQPLTAIGQRGNGPGRFRAITAISKGTNSLFIADRIELPVQELDLSGGFRYSFGEGYLTWPSAVVVDKYQRAYVSDRSDNTIRVFDDIRLVATLGGTGSAQGRFRLVTDMWLAEDNKLYVADSLNRRVQVFEVISDTPQDSVLFPIIDP